MGAETVKANFSGEADVERFTGLVGNLMRFTRAEVPGSDPLALEHPAQDVVGVLEGVCLEGGDDPRLAFFIAGKIFYVPNGYDYELTLF